MTVHRQGYHLTPQGSAASCHARPLPPDTGSIPAGFVLGVDRMRKAVTRSLMGIVRLYQLTLSPFMGGQCRFYPSCSNYALDALESHGPLKGSWLALQRLLKCHPFHPGGFDPPPRRGG